MSGKKLILDGWFSIGTENQSDIEDRAREKFGPEGEDPQERKVWLRKNFIGDRGEITQKGWDVLNEDMSKLEGNVLGWLRKNLEGVRDEGHDSSGDLIGGFWFDARNPKQLDVVLVGVEHYIHVSDFDLDSHVWKDLSDFGGSFLDVSVYLNVSEEVLDKAKALEAWERTERRRGDG